MSTELASELLQTQKFLRFRESTVQLGNQPISEEFIEAINHTWDQGHLNVPWAPPQRLGLYFQRGGSMGPATAIGPLLSTGWFHGPRHSDWASTFNGVVPWVPPQRLGLNFQRGGSMGPATAIGPLLSTGWFHGTNFFITFVSDETFVISDILESECERLEIIDSGYITAIDLPVADFVHFLFKSAHEKEKRRILAIQTENIPRHRYIDMGELIQLEPGKKVTRWTIASKLGEGAFGAVYKVSDKTGDYALKVEGANEKIQLLKMEVHVLSELKKAGGRHFCNIEDKGRVENFNYVVMTLVGRSLQDLRNIAPQKRFSSGTAIGVAIQSLESIEDLHSIGYLHRDIKPGNFTIGRKELNELRKVYVLDFGMCRKFIHEDGTIKQPRQVAGFRGTVKYASIACHRQREMCRQDDIETWLYMVVEFTKGWLPWRNVKNIDDIGNMKKDARREYKLLLGGCPREYVDILKLIDSGQFFDEPKYFEIYNLLRKALIKLGANEFPYDWEAEAKTDADKNKKEGMPETAAEKTEKTDN
ncbi:protein kinase domain-containing protein [Ditylenchus destructor]|nr:protein kinase domain-containing protein [Ditylenchus destructor]